MLIRSYPSAARTSSSVGDVHRRVTGEDPACRGKRVRQDLTARRERSRRRTPGRPDHKPCTPVSSSRPSHGRRPARCPGCDGRPPSTCGEVRQSVAACPGPPDRKNTGSGSGVAFAGKHDDAQRDPATALRLAILEYLEAAAAGAGVDAEWCRESRGSFAGRRGLAQPTRRGRKPTMDAAATTRSATVTACAASACCAARRSRRARSSSRQSGFTFTRRSRNTLESSIFSRSTRASVPMRLIMSPPRPITIGFCESCSTKIVQYSRSIRSRSSSSNCRRRPRSRTAAPRACAAGPSRERSRRPACAPADRSGSRRG